MKPISPIPGIMQGGKWKVVDEFRGRSHRDGGIDIEVSGGIVRRIHAPDSKPAAPALQANGKPDAPAPAATPVVTNADTATQGAQAAQAAAATAAASTRAIHAAYAAPVQQLNVPQVAFEVAMSA